MRPPGSGRKKAEPLRHHGAPSFQLMVLKRDKWVPVPEEQAGKNRSAPIVRCCHCKKRLETKPRYVYVRGRLRPICEECLN